jgi:hypothetical protein
MELLTSVPIDPSGIIAFGNDVEPPAAGVLRYSSDEMNRDETCHGATPTSYIVRVPQQCTISTRLIGGAAHGQSDLSVCTPVVVRCVLGTLWIVENVERLNVLLHHRRGGDFRDDAHTGVDCLEHFLLGQWNGE